MKRKLKSFVAIIIIIAMTAYSNISMAEESLSDLKSEKSSVNDKIDKAEEQLDGITAEKSETLEQVEKLISEISSYQGDIDDLKNKINDLKSQIDDLQEKIKKDEEDYQKQREMLDERIVATYKNGETSYLEFMLSSSSLIDFISSYYLISQVADYDQKLMGEVSNHKEKIESEKSQLEESKKEVESSQTTLLAKQQALKVAKKERESYINKLSDEEKETQSKIQELQDENDALDKKIKAAQAKIAAERAAAAARATQSSSSSSSSSGGGSSGYSSEAASAAKTSEKSSYGLIWPTLPRYSVTTGWYYSTGKLHGASDISGAGIYGTPIYAVADGYVIHSGYGINGSYMGYGNVVMIAHYNGLYTLYGHMSSRVATEGSSVKQGQVIGYVGSTGNSTGPHLHFEVRTGSGTYSERVNPIGYLP